MPDPRLGADESSIWYGKRASVVQNHPELQNGTAKPGFPVRNGLAVASRTAEVRFLHETTPKRPRVQQKAVFCTESTSCAQDQQRAHGTERTGTGGRGDTATLPLVYCLVVLGLPDLDLVAVGGLVAHPLGEILGGG